MRWRFSMAGIPSSSFSFFPPLSFSFLFFSFIRLEFDGKTWGFTTGFQIALYNDGLVGDDGYGGHGAKLKIVMGLEMLSYKG